MLFLLLAFGLLALTAVAVDLGLARVTADQMRVASQSAALEGLRWRDVGGDAPRRVVAAQFVELAFDDDLDPTNGDAVGFGLGPDLRVVTDSGIGALGQLVVGAGRVLEPDVQLNPDNQSFGDLVAGDFLADQPGLEAPNYQRADFVAAPPGALDQSGAFLVRLRRTGDPLGLDQVAGVSSAGPPLPWTFGLGGLLDPASRLRGVTVRGTGIAAGVPALVVSTPAAEDALDVPPMPGRPGAFGAVSPWPALSFRGDAAFARGFGLASTAPFELEYEPTTGLLRPAGADPASEPSWGVTLASDTSIAAVGDLLVAAPAAVPLPPVGTAQALTLSMHAELGGGLQRIGFRLATLEVLSIAPVALVRITPSAARVAGRGASAFWGPSRSLLATDPALAAAHQSLPAPLLAPVQGR